MDIHTRRPRALWLLLGLAAALLLVAFAADSISGGGHPSLSATSRDFRDEDIARLFDSLALALAERLQAVPDSEASLTLLSVMKERPDLCRKYFEFVPIGLRDAAPQAALDLVRSLALMKAGRSADFKYDYQATIMKNEMSRFVEERGAVAEEWIAWGKSTTPCQ